MYFFQNEAIIEIEEESGLRVYLLKNNTLTLVPKIAGIRDFSYSHGTIDDNFIFHMLCLSNDGKIYAWGKNNYYQVSISY